MRYFYDASEDRKELIIYGDGEMKQFESVSEQPWKTFNQDIKKLYIEDGIKSIG